MGKTDDIESGLGLSDEKLMITLIPSPFDEKEEVQTNFKFNSKEKKKDREIGEQFDIKLHGKETKGKQSFTIFGYRPSQIKWLNVFWLAFVHVLLVVGYVYCSLYPVKFYTASWAVFLGSCSGFGASVGAHRLFAHKSFKAHWILRLALVMADTLSMNGGCYSYARDHRCHHKFVDTNADPKNAKRGFFFAHIGWWMLKKHPDVLRMGKKLNYQDLDDEPLIVWQRKLYYPLFLLLSVVLPTLIPYYAWNEELLTAFFSAAVMRTVILLHHLFSGNSAAHMFGLRPYNRSITPTESKITMYLTMGEGSHNYHHTFPRDYANCQKAWWEVFNPAALFISSCEMIGLAWDLKKPSQEVVKGTVGRIGDPEFYETKLFPGMSTKRRVLLGILDWTSGLIVVGWAIYPPMLFKALTGRELFIFTI